MAKSAKELKSMTLKEFEKAAEQFDNDDPSVYNLCRKDYPDILAELKKEEFTDVLDAGCGTGAVIALLAKKYPKKHYTGIDLSTKMIEVASAKKTENAVFVCGDCENLLLITVMRKSRRTWVYAITSKRSLAKAEGTS